VRGFSSRMDTRTGMTAECMKGQLKCKSWFIPENPQLTGGKIWLCMTFTFACAWLCISFPSPSSCISPDTNTGLNQMSASRSIAQSVPSVSVTNHHHGHHHGAHIYQGAASAVMSGHHARSHGGGHHGSSGGGMGMVTLGGGVSGGGICGGGPFRAFRQGRMATEL
jgi:hypothetical protein